MSKKKTTFAWFDRWLRLNLVIVTWHRYVSFSYFSVTLNGCDLAHHRSSKSYCGTSVTSSATCRIPLDLLSSRKSCNIGDLYVSRLYGVNEYLTTTELHRYYMHWSGLQSISVGGLSLCVPACVCVVTEWWPRLTYDSADRYQTKNCRNWPW